MVRTVVMLALLSHGVGHLLFIGNVVGYWRSTAAGAVVAAPMPLQVGVGLLFLVPLVGFLAVAWGYWSAQPWWPAAALAAAAVSLVLTVASWGSLNGGSALAAVVFDLVVAAWVLWLRAFAATA